MDSPKPIVLANRVIQQLVSHQVSDRLALSAKEFMAIRAVFRRCGGSWADLMGGDKRQLDILKTIVTAWGSMPEQVQAAKSII